MSDLQGLFFRDFENSYIPNILQEIYRDKIYGPYMQYIKDGIVFDVGGNIGLFTHFAAPLAKKVYAVEPAKEHQETFSHMVEFNKYANVKLLPYALSHESGEVEFYHNPNKTAHSLFPALGDPALGTEKVQAITIDKLMDDEKIERINFLKLDPEGAEFAILGSEGFRKMAPRIDALVVELHAWGSPSFQQAVTTLRDLGYTVSKLPTEAYVLGAIRK